MLKYYLLLVDGIVAPGICLSGDIPAGAVECTQEQYEGCGSAYTLENGAVVAYTPPALVIPLKDQATTALASARTYVNNTYTMLNEATPDAWVTYLKALMAIASGTDTTSTALPTEPAA